MKGLSDKAVQTLKQIEETRIQCVKDIVRELEERALTNNTVTYHGLEKAIEASFERSGISRLLATVESNGMVLNQETRQAENANQSTRASGMYYWGGRFRRVPEDFLLPECSPRQLWILWCCGNHEKGWPPLRTIEGRDMKTRNMQKKLCEMRFLMNLLMQKLAELNVEISNQMDHAQAMQYFDMASDVLKINDVTEKKRKRRSGQLSWSTIAKIFKKESKK